MAFPAAGALVQGGFADDFGAVEHEEREIGLVIEVVTPILEQGGLIDPMFEEEPFDFRDAVKETHDALAIAFLHGSDDAVRAVAELEPAGVILDGVFE
jgi:hypothetical protein